MWKGLGDVDRLGDFDRDGVGVMTGLGCVDRAGRC